MGTRSHLQCPAIDSVVPGQRRRGYGGGCAEGSPRREGLAGSTSSSLGGRGVCERNELRRFRREVRSRPAGEASREPHYEVGDDAPTGALAECPLAWVVGDFVRRER